MRKPNYTPGPWRAFDNAGTTMQGYSQPSGVAVVDKLQIVCGCFGDIGGPDIASANAKLIAAAPELAEALVRMLENEGVHSVGCKEFAPGHDDSKCCPVHEARTALRSAGYEL